jgi:hypothetical protein
MDEYTDDELRELLEAILSNPSAMRIDEALSRRKESQNTNGDPGSECSE